MLEDRKMHQIGVSTVREISKQGTDIQETKTTIRSRWSWVEASIWSDSMLTALELGVKGGKWFSLIDKVYAHKTLELAWQAVKRNKGAAGIDRVTVARYERNLQKYLKELESGLKANLYRPTGIKRVYIPKGAGKLRPLGIPTVNDRVAQAAVKMVIEPILEREFLPMSYGFRPQKGAKEALREVDSLIKEGYVCFVDADLQSYFDTIPHEALMAKLERYISDGRVLDLVRLWLKQEILEDDKEWTPVEGTPQGGVLSPVLANLYLHDLDVKITQAGYKMVRYADDFVILTKTPEEAQAALSLVQIWVTENGLKLHPEKTHVGNCVIGQGFDFLGYRFEGGTRWVRQKSILKFRENIRSKTQRSRSGSIQEIIEEVNRTLKGWYEYFKHVNKWGLETFDSFVRRRLRAILRRRNKRPGFGFTYDDHKQWPNAYFAKLGLFTMERHRKLAIACQSR